MKVVNFFGVASTVVDVKGFRCRNAILRHEEDVLDEKGNIVHHKGSVLRDPQGGITVVEGKVEFERVMLSIPANSEWASLIAKSKVVPVAYGLLALGTGGESDLYKLNLQHMIEQAPEQIGVFVTQVGRYGHTAMGIKEEWLLELAQDDMNTDKATALNNASTVAKEETPTVLKCAIIGGDLFADGQIYGRPGLVHGIPTSSQQRMRYKDPATGELDDNKRAIKGLYVEDDQFFHIQKAHNIPEDFDIIMHIDNVKNKALKARLENSQLNGYAWCDLYMDPIAIQKKEAKPVSVGNGFIFTGAKKTSAYFRSCNLHTAQDMVINALSGDMDSYHKLMGTFSQSGYNTTMGDVKDIRVASTMFDIPVYSEGKFSYRPNMARGSLVALLDACGYHLKNAEKLNGCLVYSACDVRLDDFEAKAKVAGEKRSFIVPPSDQEVWGEGKHFSMKEAIVYFDGLARGLHPMVGNYSMLEVALIGVNQWAHFIATGEYVERQNGDTILFCTGRKALVSESSQYKAKKDFDGDKMLLLFYHKSCGFQPAKFHDIIGDITETEEEKPAYVPPTNSEELIEQQVKLHKAIWFGEEIVGTMSVACRKALIKKLVLHGALSESDYAWFIFFMEIWGAKAMKSMLMGDDKDADEMRKTVNRKILKGVKQDDIPELKLHFISFLESLQSRGFGGKDDKNIEYLKSVISECKKYEAFKTSWTDSVIEENFPHFVLVNKMHKVTLPEEINTDAAFVKKIAIHSKAHLMSKMTNAPVTQPDGSSIMSHDITNASFKMCSNILEKAFKLSRQAIAISSSAKYRTLNVIFPEHVATLKLIVRALDIKIGDNLYHAKIDEPKSFWSIQEAYRVTSMISYWAMCSITSQVPNWDTLEFTFDGSHDFLLKIGAMVALIVSWGYIPPKVDPNMVGEDAEYQNKGQVYTGHLFSKFPPFSQKFVIENYIESLATMEVNKLYPDAPEGLVWGDVEGFTTEGTMSKIIETFFS